MIVSRVNGLLCSLLLLVVLIPGEVHAYIGPGAGLSAIGSLLAVLTAVLLAIVGFVWYPLKRFMRRKQKVVDEDVADTPAETGDETQAEDSTSTSK